MPFTSDAPKQPDFYEVRKANDRQDKINDVGDSTAKGIEEGRRVKEDIEKGTDANNRRIGESSKQK